MTKAEQEACVESLREAGEAAQRLFDRIVEPHCEVVSGRLAAIARADLEKAFVMAQHVFLSTKTEQE
jgi:hypothetical protein